MISNEDLAYARELNFFFCRVINLLVCEQAWTKLYWAPSLRVTGWPLLSISNLPNPELLSSLQFTWIMLKDTCNYFPLKIFYSQLLVVDPQLAFLHHIDSPSWYHLTVYLNNGEDTCSLDSIPDCLDIHILMHIYRPRKQQIIESKYFQNGETGRYSGLFFLLVLIVVYRLPYLTERGFRSSTLHIKGILPWVVTNRTSNILFPRMSEC